MHKARVTDVELRFGDHGPGYIVRGPRTDVGYVVLPPGQDFPNHYHETIEEGFYTAAQVLNSAAQQRGLGSRKFRSGP